MPVEAVIGNFAPTLELDDNVEQSMFLQITDRIALPTFVIDTNHVVRHWNSALEALTGLDRSAMIGTRNHWKPFYASPRPCLADLMLEGAKDADVQHYYTHKYQRSTLIADAYEAEDFFPECGESGEWLHFTASKLHNSQGEVIGAIETLMNISDRKKNEMDLIERERRYRSQSITDNLTKLYNSRFFHQQLEQATANASRFKQPFSLCFLDFHNFDQLNIEYGQHQGDEILKTFGNLIQNSLRGMDSGYRYQDQQFAILLPGTKQQDANVVAERILKRLANYQFELENGEPLFAAISIGIAEYQSGDSVSRLVERTQHTLHQAKEAGRNCITVAN
ncbi:MAG: diguanylate cyclase [Motiliproteus sp.]|nr:diguanylate cyclase [Motiliproteus sp.]MCW9053410.1 diguanylate cyclase [Motiliproteus sp.]